MNVCCVSRVSTSTCVLSYSIRLIIAGFRWKKLQVTAKRHHFMWPNLLLSICSQHHDVYSHLGSTQNTRMKQNTQSDYNILIASTFYWISANLTALQDMLNAHSFICKNRYCAMLFG